MKKRSLTILLLLATAVASLGILASCGKEDSNIREVNYFHNETNNAYGVCDIDMTIDGVLDEQRWDNKQWFNNTFISTTDESTAASISVTTFFTEKGVYIGAILEDSNMMYSGEMQPGINSEIEFYYFINEDGKATPNGGWVDRINYFYSIIDLGGNVYGTTKSVMRAVTYKGELNTGNSESATYELFIEWSQFGVVVEDEADIPEAFYILPNVRVVMPGKSENTILCAPRQYMSLLPDYYLFTKDGYSNADADDAVLGDNKFGSAKSANWIADGNSAKIENGIDPQVIYFKEAYDENFLIKADLASTGSSRNGRTDRYLGFHFITSAGTFHNVFLDYVSGVVKQNGEYLHLNTFELSTLDNFINSWHHVTKKSIANTNQSDDFVTLEVVKYGTDLHYFIDGNYVLSESLSYMSGKVFAGLISLQAAAEVKNCEYTPIDDMNFNDIMLDLGFRFANVESGEGGTATLTKDYFRIGSSLALDIKSESGYAASKIYVNDEDKTSELSELAQGGRIVLNDLNESINVRVEFAEFSETRPVSFNIKDLNGDNVSGKIVLTKQDNGLYRSEYVVSKNGSTIELDKGTYTVAIQNVNDLYEKVNLTVDDDDNVCDLTPVIDLVSSGNKITLNAEEIVYTASTGKQYVVGGQFNTVAYTEGVFNFGTVGANKENHGIRVQSEDGQFLNLWFNWRGFAYTNNNGTDDKKYINTNLWSDPINGANPYLKYDRKDSYASASGGSNIALAYRAFVLDDVLYFFTNDKTDVLQDIGTDSWKTTWQLDLTDVDFGFKAGSKYSVGFYADAGSDIMVENVTWAYGNEATPYINDTLKYTSIFYDAENGTVTYPKGATRQNYLFDANSETLALEGIFVSNSSTKAYGFTVKDAAGIQVSFWLSWRGFAYQKGTITNTTKYNNARLFENSGDTNPYRFRDWKDVYVEVAANKAIAFKAFIVDDELIVYFNDYTGLEGDTGADLWYLTWKIDLSDADFGLAEGGSYRIGFSLSDNVDVTIQNVVIATGSEAQAKYAEMTD